WAVVPAAENQEWIEELVPQLNTTVMRLYGSTDVIGVAGGGAVKNVMGIATGFSDGLEYGVNARAALVSRGFAEIPPLSSAMGA
ncbi:glycerol-3-phosphate dehydrogenase, partial [Neisseria meningitidis]